MAKLRKISQYLDLIDKRFFLCFVFFVCMIHISTAQDIKTIVIDPGHGGKDPGNLGTGRYEKNEKEIVLDVSLQLGKYISDSFPDLEILYTRKDDSYPTLKQRTDFANKNNADLFISIHCDAFTKSSACGTSSHVMGLDYSEKNLRVVKKENSVIYLEDNYKEDYEGFDPNSTESYIVFSLTQNTYLDNSILFAQYVQEEFKNKVNREDRGVRQSPFWVISRTNMPSVLIELGFLTCPDEEDFLHSEDGQTYLASAIFRAFTRYRRSLEKDILSEYDSDKNISKEDLSFDYQNLDSTINIIFKIQLATYLTSMKNTSIFENIEVEEAYVNGTYKYFTFITKSKIEADQKKVEFRKSKFPGAFIVAFNNGEQISVKEALDLQKKYKL